MDFTSAIILWIVGFVYGICAFFLSGMRKPFPFYTGVSIPPEMITDIPSYNRANGKMWAVYSGIHIIAGFIALLSSVLGFILFGLLIFPGLVIMFPIHKRILNKFKNPASKPFY